MRSAGRVNSKVEELERWLAELQLPVDERLTLDGCLRQIDFLDGEIGALEARRVPTAVGEPGNTGRGAVDAAHVVAPFPSLTYRGQNADLPGGTPILRCRAGVAR